jgi:hypothetical protein
MSIKTTETIQLPDVASQYLFANALGEIVGKSVAEVQSDVGAGSSVPVVQSTGTSTTSVMSQNAVTTELNGKASASTLSTAVSTLTSALNAKVDKTGNPVSAFMITDGSGTVSALTVEYLKQMILAYPNLSEEDSDKVSNIPNNQSLNTLLPSLFLMAAEAIVGMYAYGVQNQLLNGEYGMDPRRGISFWAGPTAQLPLPGNRDAKTLYITTD